MPFGWADPAITPKYGNSTVHFLVVGTCACASPQTICQKNPANLSKILQPVSQSKLPVAPS